MAAAMFLRRRASWRSVSNGLHTHTTGHASADSSGARKTYQQSRGPSLWRELGRSHTQVQSGVLDWIH
jgi:hypothetical protein